ncbi:MAG: hypothetical protein JNM32_10485 [Dechloromonas sp.]|nr:hypothetical protein [Dechloromonas sp.]
MSSELAQTLSRRAAGLFLDLLERHDQLVLSRDLLRYRELVKEMVEYGLLAFETHASEIMVDVTDGQESVEVEIDKVAGVARYPCPESGRDLSIPLHEVELYRLLPKRLCKTIADQLEVGVEYAGHIETPLLPDVFWFIGNADFGGARLPVFFARSLARNLNAAINAMQGRSDIDGGLLLYSGKAPSNHVTFPGRHYAVSLADAFSTESSNATLVRPFLNRIVSGLPPDRSDPLFSFNAKSGELFIRGRTKVFKGIQRDIIAWLWKMRESDQAGFTWAEISKNANSDSKGIDDAFHGKVTRELWVEKIAAARYRLRRD